MRVVDERWNELENELGLGLPLNTLSEVDIANKWRLRALNAEKLLNQPQLTIPKSIAEKIDKFIKVLHFLNEFEAIKFLSGMDLNGDRTPQWLKDNPMLIFAYLAGKALGVDLVKVVEGWNESKNK